MLAFHLRSIQNRVESLRRTGEAEMNMMRREFQTSMRCEVETVRSSVLRVLNRICKPTLEKKISHRYVS